MSESKHRLKRRTRFLSEHRLCCFCGGVVPSTTWDHVPPKACFPRGHHPEEYEFPACLECNQGTRKADHIFGFYAHVFDHDDKNYSYVTTQRLLQGVANNYPDALPQFNLSARTKRNSMRTMGAMKPPGTTYADIPLVGVPMIFGEAALTSIRKLSCALYYKEIGRPMQVGQQIVGGWHQLQNPLSKSLTEYFNEHMSAYRQPGRSTIKDYGNRFAYKFAHNDDEDFFGCAVQFGVGIFLWSLAARPSFDMSDSIAEVWRVGEPWA